MKWISVGTPPAVGHLALTATYSEHGQKWVYDLKLYLGDGEWSNPWLGSVMPSWWMDFPDAPQIGT